MNSDNTNSSVYFATKPPELLAADVMQWTDDFYDYTVMTGRFQLWQNAYEKYWRASMTGGTLNGGGDQGQYVIQYVNHYRNLIQHLLVMTTSQRPAFEPRAVNTDYESMAQTEVAGGILDYYNRIKNIDLVLKKAVEHFLVFGEGFIFMGWDATQGKIDETASMAQNRIVKQGDVEFKNYYPMYVIFDYTGTFNNAKRQWYIIRDYQNKYELAKKYPEQAEIILNYHDESKYARNFRNAFFAKRDSDFIPVMKFFHEKTDLLPEGREFHCLGTNCWLFDSPLPYDRMPIYTIRPEEQEDSGFGYSVGFDLLSIQESIDTLYSVIITNQSMFGVQNILVPSGSNLTPKELSDGLNFLMYDPKFPKPEALNFTKTPTEIFEFLTRLEGTAETLSGVNSVARGNPESSLKSGAALALVQSMAIQFNSGLQQSYAHLLEDIGTGLIKILQQFANTPRMAEISGKSNRSYMMQFTKEDISKIDRVTVDMGNPLSRTTAGKVNMADNLLNSGLITDPEQYIQVVTSGKLEPLYEGQKAELMLIRSENEKLSDGIYVPVVQTDNHPLHINEHKSVMSSPEIRENPQLIQNILNHLQEHINEMTLIDPRLAQVLGMPVFPPMAAPVNNSESFNAENPTVQAAENVNLPNMPENPMSGQQFNTQTGGL